MTVKLVVLYTRPDDPETFDAEYRDTHIPLVAKLPGLQRWELAPVGAKPDGSVAPYYQIAEIYFSDQAALGAAFASPEGRETAAHYDKIAPEGSLMVVAEVTVST